MTNFKNPLKGYLNTPLLVAPFAVSFKASKVRRYIQPGSPLQNSLIRLNYKSKKKLARAGNWVLTLSRRYEAYFTVSAETHRKIMRLIERPESIKFEELEGFDRNQYQKYRRLFTQQYRRPYSYNLPFVPNMFVPKTAVVNFQEVISYFKSLYTAEAAKSEKS